ncbi:MAG: glycosyltransferase family 4 protein [Bacteroidota bacterium]|nr:glycosyltransferase family 4 protein [Bacteroidota bacterium]
MIVYVGNMLSVHGSSVGVIEVLSQRFSKKYTVVSTSSKKQIIPRFFQMLWTVYKNRKNCKVVLIDSYSSLAFWYTYFISLLCQMYRIPYIPILHGGNFPDRLQSSPRKCKRIFGKAACNISPSIYLKEAFEQHNFKVEYIPNSLEIETYPFKQRNIFKPNILWVRSFHYIYNPTLAPRILKIILAKYPDAQLCMVGGDKDGSLAEVTSLATELGVMDHIKITGFLPKRDWQKLSEDYDIFMSTTNFDNHPVSLIEAMSLGLPVVSTNVGGMPYLIENGVDGILVEKDKPEQMAAAIISLLENNDKAITIAKNARQKAETFDWKHISLKWYNILDKFIKK